MQRVLCLLALLALLPIAACAGEDGKAGTAGETAADGPDGADGAKGADGADGPNGAKGADGADPTAGQIAAAVADQVDTAAADAVTDQLGDALNGAVEAALVTPAQAACDAIGLEPPAKGKGVQLQMGAFFSASHETPQCMWVKAPMEGWNINGQSTSFTPGSDDVWLMRTNVTEIPTEDSLGRPHTAKEGELWDCGPEIDGQRQNVFSMISPIWDVPVLSQNPESIPADLPSDTAFKVPGGYYVIMHAHFRNPTPEGLNTCIKMNLETIADSQVQNEAGRLFFGSPVIRVPAEGTSKVTYSCPIDHDTVLMGDVQSSMRSRGSHFIAKLYDPSDALVDTLFETDEWETPSATETCVRKKAGDCQDPADFLEIAAGSRIEVTCEYTNDEDRDINGGWTTTDETCNFSGTYYSKDGTPDVYETYCLKVGVFWGGSLTLDAGGTTPGATAVDDYIEAIRPMDSPGLWIPTAAQEAVASSCHAGEVWAFAQCFASEGGPCAQACQAGTLVDTYAAACLDGCTASDDGVAAAAYCEDADVLADHAARCAVSAQTSCADVQHLTGAELTACLSATAADCVDALVADCMTEQLQDGCITPCVENIVYDCAVDCAEQTACMDLYDTVSALTVCP